MTRSGRATSGHASVASPGSRSGANATPTRCRSGALASGPSSPPPGATASSLFDGTAPDAVEQLAASLLAELTPPWSQWFGFRPGHEVTRRGPAGAGGLSSRTPPSGCRAISTAPTSRSRSTSASSTWSPSAPPRSCSRKRRSASRPPSGSAAVPAAEMFVDGDQNGQIRHHFRDQPLTPRGAPRPLPERRAAGRACVDGGEADPEQRHESSRRSCQQAAGYRLRRASCADDRGGDGPADLPLAEGSSSSRRSSPSAGSRVRASSTAARR